MTDRAQKTLQKVFGFESFLPGQEEIIKAVLAGRSALAVFPTGQGKSLCYQLPALHLSGLTLVVSPLMALMKDQVDFLVSRGIAAARLDSSLDFNETIKVYEQLSRNELKLLYVAPERFANERFVALVSGLTLSLMVIDEAHCISEWGHNFRPDYLKLADLARTFKVPAVLALTATATQKVSADIKRSFSIVEQDFIQTGFYRPNLTLLFKPTNNPDQALLQELEKSTPNGPTIVYVTRQQAAEDVAERVAGAGYPARPYHAGLKHEQRQEIQDWFMASDSAIVVATIAFGMGIDKSNIRAVFHYNLPKSLENYSQEIGRAGRDGKPSLCTTFGSADDLLILENFVYGDTPEQKSVRNMIDFILEQDKSFDCSLYELANQFDMRPLVVKTLLTYLELEGVIQSTGPFYASYKFKPLKPSTEIFSRFDAERQTFLRNLFGCAAKAKIWFTIDLQEAVRKTKSSRKRIITALDYLEQSGDLLLQVTGSRIGFCAIHTDQLDRNSLKETLVSRFQQREKNDLQRLQLVVDLVNHKGCKTRLLLNYFGEEPGADCDHCQFCLHGENEGIQREINTPPEPDKKVMGRIKELRVEYPEALGSTRQMSRFLCGLPSPMLSREKLTKHGLFGWAASFSFTRIMGLVEEAFP